MSDRRQRTKIIPVRVSSQEAATIAKIADATGQSAAALLRNTLLRIPLPRTRRPKLHEPLFAKALARLAGLTAELGKQGSNLNQIAHALNAGRPPERILGMLEACLQDLGELQRDALEYRTLIMQAMGMEKLPRDSNS
jgi:hypothetical protein